jgi:hypothetical protein
MNCIRYSRNDIVRKIGKIKDTFYNDGFYNTPVVVKNHTLSASSGFFNRNATVTTTSALVSGIVEFGPEIVLHDEVVEKIGGDVRLTVRVADKDTILTAEEIWIGCTLSGTIVTSYDDATMYKIKNDKPTMYEEDHIFVLEITGTNDGNS